jgi:hypothetical protein
MRGEAISGKRPLLMRLSPPRARAFIILGLRFALALSRRNAVAVNLKPPLISWVINRHTK